MVAPGEVAEEQHADEAKQTDPPAEADTDQHELEVKAIDAVKEAAAEAPTAEAEDTDALREAAGSAPAAEVVDADAPSQAAEEEHRKDDERQEVVTETREAGSTGAADDKEGHDEQASPRESAQDAQRSVTFDLPGVLQSSPPAERHDDCEADHSGAVEHQC